MEERSKHNTVYHWVDLKEQPRISYADDANDMAELSAYIEQCKIRPTGHPIYVYASVEGSITEPTKLLE
jgi:hypothetical protein